MTEEIGAWIILYCGFSLFWAMATLADGVETMDNKPTTWLTIIAGVPGFIIIGAFGLLLAAVHAPFWYLDSLWEKYKK